MSRGNPLGSFFGLLLGHRSQEQSSEQLQLQAPNHPGLLRYRPRFPLMSAGPCPYASYHLESGHLPQLRPACPSFIRTRLLASTAAASFATAASAASPEDISKGRSALL